MGAKQLRYKRPQLRYKRVTSRCMIIPSFLFFHTEDWTSTQSSRARSFHAGLHRSWTATQSSRERSFQTGLHRSIFRGVRSTQSSRARSFQAGLHGPLHLNSFSSSLDGQSPFFVFFLLPRGMLTDGRVTEQQCTVKHQTCKP